MSTLTASHGLTLSPTGLKLIKAYEGYRPVDRTLVSGHRVVGYGHRLFDDAPVQMTKSEAEALLKSDLEAFEDMINENVHAPVTQGQFDALVSFAFNIGPKAFLASDTLRALNNGRPLDAANGMDVWRKSTISGKTYVVDALMRRRTAEKALFLRLDSKPHPAPGVDLPPVQDENVNSFSIVDEFPVFSEEEASGIVAKAPYEAQDIPSRRREDGQAGILMLSEVVDDLDPFEADETSEIDESEENDFETAETVSLNSKRDAVLEIEPDEADEEKDLFERDEGEINPNRSVIADAAADISDRLDALIDKVQDDETSGTKDWPESLIQSESLAESDEEDKKPVESFSEDNLVSFPGQRNVGDVPIELEKESRTTRVPSKAEIEAAIFATDDQDKDRNKQSGTLIDNLREDDAMRDRSDSASRYIERYAPSDDEDKKNSNLGFWIIMLTGFILLGASFAARFRGAESLLGESGPLLIMAGLLIGAVMILGAAYYAIRQAFR